MLGVSLRTVRQHMSEYNLSAKMCYSDIDDAGLDRIVDELKQNNPSCGYHMMDGLLQQKGIRVQQMCIREALHRTDPHGNMVRLSDLIQQRKYHVAGPQSLWYIDGNHKLIKQI